MRRGAGVLAPTTCAALIGLAACASDSRTSTTPPATRVSTLATTTLAPPTSVVGSISRDSILAIQACLGALVDDATSPGAAFVEKVRKLSVGYPLVEPLDAAQTLCARAGRQLGAEAPQPGSTAAELLTATNELNAALDVAAEQIRHDAFYRNGAEPAQFIPDGAAALQQSVAAFYTRASFTLRM